MIKVLIADDHPMIREGVHRIVAGTGDIAIAAEATDGRQLLERARSVKHDLILLDLSMPGSDGLELLKQLRRERPNIPVLVLTMHAEDQYAIRMFRAGARGYVTKDTAPTELLGAVRRVVAGGRYISPAVAEKLAGHLAAAGEHAPHERLSDREYQVFRMIAAGKSTRDISTELSLSVKTISTYRTRIFEKMGMRSPAALAIYAVRNRLTE
jgi:DNA-binding NarL/FixJ family response regulator